MDKNTEQECYLVRHEYTDEFGFYEKENIAIYATEKLAQRDFVISKFENFLALLVKNPRAIEMISEHRSVPIFEQYAGGGGFHSTKPEYTTGTKEKTEYCGNFITFLAFQKKE